MAIKINRHYERFEAWLLPDLDFIIGNRGSCLLWGIPKAFCVLEARKEGLVEPLAEAGLRIDCVSDAAAKITRQAG